MANNRIRYNWGVCTNRDADGNGTPCECCASKEKQRVLASHEFVCRVCKEPLQKVQAPKSFAEKYKGLLIGVAAVAVIGGAGAGIALSGGDEEKQQASTENTAKQDQAQDTAAVASTQTASANSSPKHEGSPTTVTKEEQTKVVVEKHQTTTTQASSYSASSGSKDLGYAVYSGG